MLADEYVKSKIGEYEFYSDLLRIEVVLVSLLQSVLTSKHLRCA
ncbi:hypothetical protein VCHA30O60_10360 [Vibrio chagasii]|nr:hypothetical protein VCHA30O60_10360 [Vibrio chagasii]